MINNLDNFSLSIIYQNNLQEAKKGFLKINNHLTFSTNSMTYRVKYTS